MLYGIIRATRASAAHLATAQRHVRMARDADANADHHARQRLLVSDPGAQAHHEQEMARALRTARREEALAATAYKRHVRARAATGWGLSAPGV